jgi:hypothetical protein
MEKGGLSSAGGTYNRCPFALAEGELDSLEDVDAFGPISKGFVKLLNLNQLLQTIPSFTFSTLS